MAMILLKVLILQAIVASCVIFVLMRVLDLQLQQLAVKKLDYVKFDKEDLQSECVVLSAPGNISAAVQQKIAHVCQKKIGRPLKIVTKKDRALKGGLVICLKKTIIDFSLIGRLKEGGIIRA